MEKPFPAYVGSGPYVFVCYAHEDSATVYPEIEWLRGQDINIWYDEGISPGKNWRRAIGDALLGAAIVVFYVSRRSLESNHCNREINLALDEGKEIVPVYLHEVELTSDLKIGLSRVQALYHSDDDYRARLLAGLGGTTAAAPASALKDQRAPRRRNLAILSGLLLFIALGWWGWSENRSSVAPDKPTIAVLPFEDLSAESNQTYFSDGMSQHLTTSLAQISGIRVISHTSAQQYRNGTQSLPEIARELNATMIVEGSVLRVESAIQLSTRLIDARSDELLWADQFDGPVSDIFSLQADVARALANNLQVKLTVGEQSQLANTYLVDEHAYELYLRALGVIYGMGPSDWRRAIDYLNDATSVDPGFALAHATLAAVLVEFARFGRGGGDDALRNARAAATRALALDPNLAEAHNAIAQLAFGEWHIQEARVAFERALMLKPSLAEAHMGLCFLLQAAGEFDGAVAAARRAVEIDPREPAWLSAEGRALYRSHRFEEAIAVFERILEMDPNNQLAHSRLSDALVMVGEFERAQSHIDRFMLLTNGRRPASLGVLYAKTDRIEKARAIASESSTINSARIHAALGDFDQALSELEIIVQERRTLPFVLRDPYFDVLASAPRYRELMHDAGLSI